MLSRARGFTLIELMIVVAIMGILLAIAIPSYRVWMLNLKIRNAAEATLNGLTQARSEAVRRNALVRFQFVDGLTNGCTLAASSTNWIISQDDATGACGNAISETAAPRIIQKRQGGEGSSQVVLAVTPAGATTVTFNGLGRVVANADASATPTQMDFDLPTTLLSADASRDLRVQLSSPGGQIRMCDPNVSVTTDPRGC